MSNTHLVELINSTPTTTSLKVAEYFGKDHSKVLAIIRTLIDQDNEADFSLVDYLDNKGENRPMFNLTKDGFTLLAMGFTGKKALGFKKDYIKAFNLMESQLSKPKVLTTLEVLQLATSKIEELSKELTETKLELEHKQAVIVDITETVPPQTMRATINRVVRDYSKLKGIYFNFVWNKLYTEFKYIYNVDLKTRAKNQKKAPIQVAQDTDNLENLYKLSLKMFEV
jgi:anti-repressor protein